MFTVEGLGIQVLGFRDLAPFNGLYGSFSWVPMRRLKVSLGFKCPSFMEITIYQIEIIESIHTLNLNPKH